MRLSDRRTPRTEANDVPEHEERESEVEKLVGGINDLLGCVGGAVGCVVKWAFIVVGAYVAFAVLMYICSCLFYHPR